MKRNKYPRKQYVRDASNTKNEKNVLGWISLIVSILAISISGYFAYHATFPNAKIFIKNAELCFSSNIWFDSTGTNEVYGIVEIYNDGNKTTSINSIGFLILDSTQSERIHIKAKAIEFANIVEPGNLQRYIFQLDIYYMNADEQPYQFYQLPIEITPTQIKRYYEQAILKNIDLQFVNLSLARNITLEVAVHTISEEKPIIFNKSVDRIKILPFSEK